MGQHDGIAFYTIGQRKGLRISSPEPLYVLEKDPKTNTLVVGPRQALGCTRFQVVQVNWVAGAPPEAPVEAYVRVRYKAQEVRGQVTALPGAEAEVTLSQPVPDVTPGQAAVFYSGEECLGGGIIRS